MAKNTDLQNHSRHIDYYGKDFSILKTNLVNYAKSYFPYSGNDFTVASPALMFLETVAYVGDLLSFYIDRQIQETFMQTAVEKENVIQLANLLGYTHKNTSAATVTLNCYQLLPRDSSIVGDAPDFSYALKINEGSMIKTNDGSNVSFRTLSDVSFKVTGSSDTEISIYEIVANQPNYYLIKKQVRASSGILSSETFYFTDDTPANVSIKINNTNVINILDITDSNGNTWYEVPYLAQQTILETIKNDTSATSDLSYYENETPYLLNLIVTNKKFIRRVNFDNTTEIIFGSGVSSTADNSIIPNQENVNQGFETQNINNRNLDPTNFLYLQANGEVPKNLTLTVRYYHGGGFQANVSQNTISDISDLLLGSINETGLNQSLLKVCKNSIYFSNNEPAVGGRGEESIEEIRQNATAFFNAQNRCVTAQDYMIRALSLPQKLGSISKVFVKKDDQISTKGNKIENPLAINLYCLAYDPSKKVSKLNLATKINLQRYLDFYRIATDAINIKDAYIINIGVKFSIVVLKDYNQNETLLKCILELKKFFNTDNMQINKPIIHSDIFTLISLVPGVQSVVSIKLENKSSSASGYSGIIYNTDSATRGGILYPAMDPSIFEIKFPDSDIEGLVVNY